MWSAIVAAFTTDYGDTVPSTPGGWAVSTILGLVSILMLVYPISVISTIFLAQYNALLKGNSRTVFRKRADLLHEGQEMQNLLDAVENETDALEYSLNEFKSYHDVLTRSMSLFSSDMASQTKATHNALDKIYRMQRQSTTIDSDDDE